MTSDTYIISYAITYPNGKEYAGKMRVHRCSSELHAKIKLGDFLMDRMGDGISIEIVSCKLENPLTKLFNGLFD